MVDTQQGAVLVFDNTGGPSPNETIGWYQSKLPWPSGPLSCLLRHQGPVHRPGLFNDDDPREALRKRLRHIGPDDYVIVKASEIEAVYQMRICRSTHDFDRDEDGPTAVHTAYCILEAGHTRRHTNGYHSWDAEQIPVKA